MREVAIEQKKVYSNDAWLGPTSAVGLVPLSVVDLVSTMMKFVSSHWPLVKAN